jgi:hypothetical protein
VKLHSYASRSLAMGQLMVSLELHDLWYVPGYSKQQPCEECIFSSSELEPRPM